MNLLHAATGGDGEVARVHETGAPQIPRKDPDPVAAHLGDRTVGVAVVHEPLGPVGHGPRLGVRGGPYDVQQPVATDTGAAVAELRDGGGGQGDRVVRVRNDHEVVLGPVALEERDG